MEYITSFILYTFAAILTVFCLTVWIFAAYQVYSWMCWFKTEWKLEYRKQWARRDRHVNEGINLLRGSRRNDSQ